MSKTWDYDRLTNELDAQSVELGDWAIASEAIGDMELSTLLRNASAAVAAAWQVVEQRRRLAARTDAEHEAAILAVLKPGETIESFEARAIAKEIERRQREGAAAP